MVTASRSNNTSSLHVACSPSDSRSLQSACPRRFAFRYFFSFVRTRISTKEKKYRKANRLGHALCKERESLGEQATCKEDVLLERLAVTIPLAWHQDAWTTLPQLRKLIAREVLSDLQHRSRSKKHDREHLLEPPLNFSESMANDFVQQLEAEDAYRAWFHRAGLTAYEAD